MNLIISILLLGVGIRYFLSGLLKIFRFYVGRGIPASLSQNFAPSESLTNEPEVMYESKHLEQMLMGRKNPTFAFFRDSCFCPTRSGTMFMS
ncbi:MAG: hypothetical protein GX279_08795 [Clostridiaceae bacterium]|nr:hypothetical protein [Clostridiaceae bacterium]